MKKCIFYVILTMLCNSDNAQGVTESWFEEWKKVSSSPMTLYSVPPSEWYSLGQVSLIVKGRFMSLQC